MEFSVWLDKRDNDAKVAFIMWLCGESIEETFSSTMMKACVLVTPGHQAV